MNPFVAVGTLLYVGAAVWYFINGQWPQGGMFVGYAIANVFILMIK